MRRWAHAHAVPLSKALALLRLASPPWFRRPARRRKWTLNWSEVTPDIVVGSCPRSPEDVVRPSCIVHFRLQRMRAAKSVHRAHLLVQR